MSDTEKKIAEIREALEKATQGPWKWIDPGGLERKKLVGEWEIMNFGVSAPYSEIAGQEPDDNDAHLIANAPEWLRFLLDELERLEREYAEERAAHNAHVAELCELKQERNMYKASSEVFYERLKKAWEERDKLIEVLRWYAEADYDHKIMTDYYEDDGELFYGTELDLDRGQRARDILREIGVTVE